MTNTQNATSVIELKITARLAKVQETKGDSVILKMTYEGGRFDLWANAEQFANKGTRLAGQLVEVVCTGEPRSFRKQNGYDSYSVQYGEVLSISPVTQAG